MKVLLAGATGAIGTPLIAQLTAAGHEVTATTRSAQKAAAITGPGVTGVVLDAYDADAVRRVVAGAEPEVVIHQLTALPQDPSKRGAIKGFEETAKLRIETVPTFAATAAAAGARRLLVQSISFVTRPDGPQIQDEDAPLWLDAPPDVRPGIEAVSVMERAALEAAGIEALVLRYGFFYGPGTWYHRDGALGRMLARRRLPMVGSGAGLWSWIDIEDAAAVTVAALDGGAPGVYNVVDDEPVAARDWMPIAAAAAGAGKPFRLPVWLARRVVGNGLVHYNTTLRGASNARMRDAFGVQPRPWQDGLTAALV